MSTHGAHDDVLERSYGDLIDIPRNTEPVHPEPPRYEFEEHKHEEHKHEEHKHQPEHEHDHEHYGAPSLDLYPSQCKVLRSDEVTYLWSSTILKALLGVNRKLIDC
ncbi:hypothetical protein TELCIR_07198 [Teladorsagia circumcincta]|uniref:Uncharacterized protein n=1 Tax=Teladorsagia circumcincta TaxID=45464 RepID=A0A2G9UKX3_TELCI|nr:hypothetical protein TELCIR_07198 [Teladorsagia circumcincta]